jgi:hypothetical protein
MDLPTRRLVRALLVQDGYCLVEGVQRTVLWVTLASEVAHDLLAEGGKVGCNPRRIGVQRMDGRDAGGSLTVRATRLFVRRAATLLSLSLLAGALIVLRSSPHATASCFPGTTIGIYNTTIPTTTLPSTTIPGTTVPDVCECWTVKQDVVVTQPPPEVTACPLPR